MSDIEWPDVDESNYVAFVGDNLPDVLRRAATWIEQNNPVFYAVPLHPETRMCVMSNAEQDAAGKWQYIAAISFSARG